MQVRRSALVLYWESFEALVDLFVLGSLLGLLLLGVAEAGGDASGAAVAAPHGRLQHLHGVAPLAHGAAHGIQGRAVAGQRARHRGGVLPRGLGRPGFGLVILGKQNHSGLVWLTKNAAFLRQCLTCHVITSLRFFHKIRFYLKAELMHTYSTLKS